MIGVEERQTRFARLAKLAAEFDIDLHICSCKNPDLASGSNCQIAGPPTEASRAEEALLFQDLG